VVSLRSPYWNWFNIFSNDEGGSIECNLSKFADDTKLSGAVDTLEVRYAIQSNPDRLEKTANVHDLKFNSAKCKFLHPRWRNHQSSISTD